MSLPNGPWTHDGQVPCHNKAVGITGQEALIVSNEGSHLHRCLVASQNRLGLGGPRIACHVQVICDR